MCRSMNSATVGPPSAHHASLDLQATLHEQSNLICKSYSTSSTYLPQIATHTDWIFTLDHSLRHVNTNRDLLCISRSTLVRKCEFHYISSVIHHPITSKNPTTNSPHQKSLMLILPLNFSYCKFNKQVRFSNNMKLIFSNVKDQTKMQHKAC